MVAAYGMMNDNKDEQDLKKWNFIAFLLHLGSSLFMAPWIRGDPEWTVQATYVDIAWNSTDPDKKECGKDECTVQQCTHFVGGNGIPLESLVFAFHFGSALAHFGYWKYHEQYYAMVVRNGNPYRWLEYAITAAFMIVVIMVTVGIVALWELVDAAILTAATQFFGFICEYAVQQRPVGIYKSEPVL